MKSRFTALSAALATAILLAAPAQAQYRVRDLGGMDFALNGRPYAINSQGQVAGVVAVPGGLKPFVWLNSIFTTFATLGGAKSEARGINDLGDICGFSETGEIEWDGSPVTRGFVTVGGTMQALGTLGGSKYSFAYGINNAGNVVGNSNGRAFFHTGITGTMVALPSLDDVWSNAIAYGINEDNVVVGASYLDSRTYHAVRWRYDPSTGEASETLDLGTFDYSWRNSIAYGVNRSGHVAGVADDYLYGARAFLWRDGEMTAVGTLPGFAHSIARGLNSEDTVVGYSFRNEFPQSDHRAFVYRNGELADLSAQLPAGWEAYEAYSINDAGQIVAWGKAPYSSSRMLLLEPDQAPVAQNDSAKCAGNSSVAIDALVNDSDPEGDPLQISAYTQPSLGGVTLNGGVFTYTPNPWAGGTDSFSYTIDDGYGATSTATVTILVTAANVTSLLTISRDTPRLERKTGLYTQHVTIKRSGAGSPPLPLSLVLDGLTSGVTLVGAAGTTAETSPIGSPYVNVSNGSDTVIPTKGLKITLTFLSRTASINYTPRVLAGAGPR